MLYEFLKENTKESIEYYNLNLHILANPLLLL